MEPEGSISNSQELSTCSYPEPDQSHKLISEIIYHEEMGLERNPPAALQWGAPDVEEECIQCYSLLSLEGSVSCCVYN
jgi:hypothetical protein